MHAKSNWPDGVDRGHSNFTLRFPRTSRYDGVGGWAPNSSKIRIWPALFYCGVGTLFVWGIFRLPLLIWA